MVKQPALSLMALMTKLKNDCNWLFNC